MRITHIQYFSFLNKCNITLNRSVVVVLCMYMYVLYSEVETKLKTPLSIMQSNTTINLSNIVTTEYKSSWHR